MRDRCGNQAIPLQNLAETEKINGFPHQFNILISHTGRMDAYAVEELSSEMHGKKTAFRYIETGQGEAGRNASGQGRGSRPTFVAAWRQSQGICEADRVADQMGTIRLGQRTDKNSPSFNFQFVPLPDLKEMVFTGWDISKTTCIRRN